MPRRLRVHVPGAFYHVTLRGNHRQPVFFAVSDRKLLGDLIAGGLTRCSARLHAYCWMTNHIHLLVQVGDAPLGALVQHVAGRYARSVQARLHTKGHLFENRYHAVMVSTDAHLLELLRYVHLNPVRAGIVDDVAAYAWSSHAVYAGRRRDPWLTTAFMFDMLDTRPDRQRAAYVRFMDSGQPDGSGAASRPAEGGPGIEVPEPGRGARHGVASKSASCQESLPDLADQAVAYFGITHEALLSPARTRMLSRARQRIVQAALERGVASVSEAARFLWRDESSLRKGLARQMPR